MGVIKRELAAMLPPLVFFLIGFTLIVVTLHLALEQDGIPYSGMSKAVVGALVIAKVVLIVDHLPIFGIFSDRPLIRPVLYRTLIYTALAMLAHMLEGIIGEWVQVGNLATAMDSWTGAFVWQHFVFVLLWVSSLFLVFNTFQEIRQAYSMPPLLHLLTASHDDR